jgi:hypothetical protein
MLTFNMYLNGSESFGGGTCDSRSFFHPQELASLGVGAIDGGLLPRPFAVARGLLVPPAVAMLTHSPGVKAQMAHSWKLTVLKGERLGLKTGMCVLS